MSSSYLFNQVLLTFINNFKEHREDLSAVLLTHQKYLWLGLDETSTIEQLSLVDPDKFTEHKQFWVAEFISLPASKEEGIGIYQNRIFLGLRDPVLRGWAVVLEIELENSSPRLLKLGPIGEAKELYKKHFLWVNGVNSQENVFSNPDLVQDIPYGNREEHAEGMTLFKDVAGIPSLLVVYDSPAKTRLVGDIGVIADVFKLG